MYFKTRGDAGDKLAELIMPRYGSMKCTVVALNDGGVMVGAHIAQKIKCPLTMLLTASIDLPREGIAIGAVTPTGNMTYNPNYSAGEIDEMEGEYRTLIDQERLGGLHDMNLLGSSGLIRKDLLKGHIVITVADGLDTSFLLETAADFLKPIKIDKFVIATPLASVPAFDRMRIVADDNFCLDVIGDYMNTDHYYESNDVPDHNDIIKIIKSSVSQW
jgi:putative phosphoribosyl transferase